MNKSKKIKDYSFKILILIIMFFLSSYLFISCSTIKNCATFTVSMLQYKQFISEDKNFKIRFDTNTGQLTDLKNRGKLYYDYEYSSGMTICRYEEVIDEEIIEKEIHFIFIDEQLLYSKTYHLIFINFDDLKI